MRYLTILVSALLLSTPAWGKNAVNFRVELSGANEVPPVETDTTGSAILHVDRDLTEIRFRLDIRDGEGVLGAAGAHIHCGGPDENGPVVSFLAGPAAPGFDGRVEFRGTLNDNNVNGAAGCGDTVMELVEAMLNGNTYINVHSVLHPGGVVRGQVE